jgi:hypothetical protein
MHAFEGQSMRGGERVRFGVSAFEGMEHGGLPVFTAQGA